MKKYLRKFDDPWKPWLGQVRVHRSLAGLTNSSGRVVEAYIRPAGFPVSARKRNVSFSNSFRVGRWPPVSPSPPPRHFVVVSESLMRGERGYVYILCSGPSCMRNQPREREREGKFQRLLLSDGRKANHCIIYEPLPPPPWTICQFPAPCFFVSIVGPAATFLPFLFRGGGSG